MGIDFVLLRIKSKETWNTEDSDIEVTYLEVEANFSRS